MTAQDVSSITLNQVYFNVNFLNQIYITYNYPTVLIRMGGSLLSFMISLFTYELTMILSVSMQVNTNRIINYISHVHCPPPTIIRNSFEEYSPHDLLFFIYLTQGQFINYIRVILVIFYPPHSHVRIRKIFQTPPPILM